MACGCQHMALAVMLGNTSDCHVMRCSARCWGHTVGRAAHSPYLLLNRICTHSRSVLMSSVSFMKASHFSIKTQEVQVRAEDGTPQPGSPVVSPVPGWGCALETATLPPRPQRPALVLLPVPTSDPKPSPLRKQPHTHPGCSDGLPTCSLLLPLSAPMGNGHGAGSACPSRAPRPPEGREAGRTLPPGKQRLSPHLEDLTNPHASYIWGLVQPQPCGLPPNPQPAGLLHKTKASASVHSVTRVIICHYNYTVTSLIH